MVSTLLKNICQNGNLPKVGENKIKNVWNHHLASELYMTPLGRHHQSHRTRCARRRSTHWLANPWCNRSPRCALVDPGLFEIFHCSLKFRLGFPKFPKMIRHSMGDHHDYPIKISFFGFSCNHWTTSKLMKQHILLGIEMSLMSNATTMWLLSHLFLGGGSGSYVCYRI